MNKHAENIYRVKVIGDVYVTYLGIYDPQLLDDYYTAVTTMPMWAQRKLAVLHTIPFEPPMPHVSGVGKRMTNDVYWLDVTENDYGYDAGEESKEQSGSTTEGSGGVLFLSSNEWIWSLGCAGYYSVPQR